MKYSKIPTTIDEQIQLIKERGMPEPKWQSGKNTGVTLTFYAPKNQIGGQIGGQIDLPERQAEVLELIRKNPSINRKNLAQVMKINESAVQKHTDALKKKGFIRRSGKTRGPWEIVGS